MIGCRVPASLVGTGSRCLEITVLLRHRRKEPTGIDGITPRTFGRLVHDFYRKTLAMLNDP
jgi:hypothetical protein